MTENINADRATIRLEAAIKRHTGWQIEYDITLIVNDRKRLLARIADLEAEKHHFARIVEEAEDVCTCMAVVAARAIVRNEEEARSSAE